MEQEKNRTNQGYRMILLAGILWGTGGYFVRQMNALGAHPYMGAFLSHAFSTIFIFIYLLATHGLDGIKISKKGLVISVVLGVLTKGIFKLAYDYSVTLVGMSTGVILMYLAPLFTALMSFFVFGERLTQAQLIALIFNLMGCILVVTGGDLRHIDLVPLGLLLGLVSAFLYALNTVLGKLAVTEDPPITTGFYMILFSALTMLPFGMPWIQADIFFSSTFLKWALLNALISGSLANILYLKGLGMGVDASKATVLSSVEVVVAVLMGVFLLNEDLNVIAILGITIMLGSVLMMNLKPLQKNIKPLIEAKEV